MKQRFSFILALFGLVLITPVFAQWSIESFNATYEIRPDATMHVIEKIKADFTQAREKHGIIRNIPFQNKDDKGNWYNVPLKHFKVTRPDGTTRKVQITTNGREKSLKIGTPNKHVSSKETYVIEYDVKGALVYFDTWDELYWNVTGNNWDVPIQSARAKIILPKGNKLSKSKCFTGRKGSTAENCKIDNFSNSFVSQTSFRPGEGFTIVAGFPKGLVEEITYRTEVQADPYAIFFLILKIILGLIPVGMGLLAWNHWRKYGRDPKVFGTVIPRYSAPKGMSPAQVGALADEVVHPRDITAMIIDLASRGFLSIEKTKTKGLIFSGTDHLLKKQNPVHQTMTIAEKYLLESLFGTKTETKLSELRNKFYSNVDKISDEIFNTLVLDGYFPESPRAVRKKYKIILNASIVGFWILTILFQSIMEKTLIVAHLPLIFSIIFVLALCTIGGRFFINSMPVKTLKGAKANLHIKGYKQFLKTAEKDRLKWADRQNIFESNLAYAVALDVVDSWTEVFGDAITPPTWYQGDGSINNFSHDFSQFTDSLSHSLISKPHESGSGGGGGSFGSGFSGGFSGGGGGGGGGSSW